MIECCVPGARRMPASLLNSLCQSPRPLIVSPDISASPASKQYSPMNARYPPTTCRAQKRALSEYNNIYFISFHFHPDGMK